MIAILFNIDVNIGVNVAIDIHIHGGNVGARTGVGFAPVGFVFGSFPLTVCGLLGREGRGWLRHHDGNGRRFGIEIGGFRSRTRRQRCRIRPQNRIGSSPPGTFGQERREWLGHRHGNGRRFGILIGDSHGRSWNHRRRIRFDKGRDLIPCVLLVVIVDVFGPLLRRLSFSGRTPRRTPHRRLLLFLRFGRQTLKGRINRPSAPRLSIGGFRFYSW